MDGCLEMTHGLGAGRVRPAQRHPAHSPPPPLCTERISTRAAYAFGHSVTQPNQYPRDSLDITENIQPRCVSCAARHGKFLHLNPSTLRSGQARLRLSRSLHKVLCSIRQCYEQHAFYTSNLHPRHFSPSKACFLVCCIDCNGHAAA